MLPWFGHLRFSVKGILSDQAQFRLVEWSHILNR